MELLEQFRPLLKLLLLPPGGLIILFFTGLLLGKKWPGKLLIWLTAIGFYLLSISFTTHCLAPKIEIHPPLNTQQTIDPPVQAILLLAAGFTRNNPELDGQPRPGPYSLERLSYASRLARETGLPLIITGGKVYPKDRPVAETMGEWLQEQTGLQPLALETRSTTTDENLKFSAPLLKSLTIDRVIIVTHAFHMARAMRMAEHYGIDAIAAPFGYIGRHMQNQPHKPTGWDWVPDVQCLRHNYLLLHEWLGAIWYAWKTPAQGQRHTDDLPETGRGKAGVTVS